MSSFKTRSAQIEFCQVVPTSETKAKISLLTSRDLRVLLYLLCETVFSMVYKFSDFYNTNLPR
jgi:hypothetical protein